MPPANPFFTDNTTFINPMGLAFTLLMGFLVLILPRRFAILPIMATICYMTMGMRFVIGGLNFTMIRLLLICCWMRLVMRREFRRLETNEIDKAVVWFTVASIITHTFLLGSDGLKYKLGQAYDAVGFYFFFRFLFKDWDDVRQMAKLTAVLLLPLALEMLSEKLTLINRFAIFGGVSPDVILREGTARAQGPFGHPILAGTFGATLMPFMVALWAQGGSGKFFAIIGTLSAAAIAGLAGSSGPILAFGFGLLAIVIWPIRKRMRWLRWAMVLTVITLHLVMKAPVWFLLARVSVFDASTGYHRAILIDRCIANFSDWWLIGTTSYANWGYYLFDRTNHYICLATDGGLLTLVLFFVILTRCYRAVGKTVRAAQEHDFQQGAWFTWALGAALVVHCVSFISVTYFDQNMVNWYLLLAMIASAGHICRNLNKEGLEETVGRPTAAPQGLELDPSNEAYYLQ
jgi:hypothetical protein